MCMTAINEWSPLKKVVVGIADNARMPPVDDSHRYINHCDKAWQDIQVGLYDQTIIDQANQDLSVMVKHLEAEGVEVVRPTVNDCEYYNYCPRDSVFHYGDITIATPMPVYARRNEWRAFGHHLQNVIELKCSACGHNKCSFFQLQTRSCDEPITTFYTCLNCGKKWKN